MTIEWLNERMKWHPDKPFSSNRSAMVVAVFSSVSFDNKEQKPALVVWAKTGNWVQD